GAAWHAAFTGVVGARMGAALVASVEGTHRLWFTNGNGVFWMDQATSLHNPLQNPTARFRAHGALETGWTDLGFTEMTKLGLYLDVETRQCSETETITFYIDFDESGEWQELGTVTTNGQTVFEIGGESGKPFRSVALK